ncbi:sugar transferase [Tessaracoccus sp. Z1128]
MSRFRPYDLVKRAIDVVAAAGLLAVTAPIQVGVAALVRVKLGSPVLFHQERPGRNGRLFKMVKFRTMLEPTADLVTDEQRLTRFGKLLRSTSLDELPELWNVLKGDMSLVGPRPLLPSYLPLYTPRQARRHEVRPGITGLAQVRGRNASSWGERLAWDVTYVDQRSLVLDLRVLVETVAVVLRRDGVAEEGAVTRTPFEGAPDTGSTSAEVRARGSRPR